MEFDFENEIEENIYEDDSLSNDDQELDLALQLDDLENQKELDKEELKKEQDEINVKIIKECFESTNNAN